MQAKPWSSRVAGPLTGSRERHVQLARIQDAAPKVFGNHVEGVWSRFELREELVLPPTKPSHHFIGRSLPTWPPIDCQAGRADIKLGRREEAGGGGVANVTWTKLVHVCTHARVALVPAYALDAPAERT